MSYLLRIAQTYPAVELIREELAYYARHILLPGIGSIGQRKLKAARVLVIGAGGLGCPVLQALAGAGVGRLTVVDGDAVAVSNLSRQWLHRYADAGQNKARSAERSLSELNPFIEIVAEPYMLSPENAAALVEAHDLVVDASDELAVRYWIDDACADLDRPWVHAALYREGSQMTVFWARYGVSFRKLYPEPSEAPSCAGAGMLGATASIVGNLQALEAIKLITGNATPQVGKLVSFNAAGLSLQSFNFPEVSAPLLHSDRPAIAHSISVDALQQVRSIHTPLQLLDIRSRSLYDAGTIEGAQHCSAEQILEVGLPDPTAAHVVIFCQEGSISQILVDALYNRHSPKLESLSGGYEAWGMTE
jgi:adenylyltransferase/sulfurtransferase